MFWVLVSLIILTVLIVTIIVAYDLNQNLSDDTPLIFVHIPKNAGTTITQIAKDNGINWTYQTERTCNCTKYHIPPSEVIKSYRVPIFCVVRNPYTRILSEYNYMKTTQDLNEYVSEKLDQLIHDPHIDDCHWVPQYEYAKYCDHILRFENLETEFNALMMRYNFTMRLNKHENKGDKKLSISDLSPENITKINNYYHKDFEKFGYSMIIL